MHFFCIIAFVYCVVYSSAMIPSLIRNGLPRQHTYTGRLASALFSTGNQHIKSYRMDGVGEGTKVEITTDTGHALTTDIPKKMGGSDSAPQPVETLVAAWMGCTQATALFVGRCMPERVVIQKLEFENIQAFRDERGALQLPITKTPDIPSRLEHITGKIRVFSCNAQGLSSKQIELLKEQTEIRCPVANMILASGCSIDVEWVDASTVNTDT